MNFKRSYIVLLFVATLMVDHANSANILVLSFFSTKSHKLTYLPLIEELGKRGHNVTMVSPVKAMKAMTNVHEIYTIDVDSTLKSSNFNGFEMKEKGQPINPAMMMGMIKDVCEKTYELPPVTSLLKQKFDLVFIQPMFNECVLGLIYRLQIPFLLFTPVSIPGWIGNKVGANFPSSITPNVMLGYPPEMNFYQRFFNLGMDTVVQQYMSLYYEPVMEKIYRDNLGQDIPSINEIYSNASLVLSNGHFSLSPPKPYFPDVIDVGGIHSRPAKPIPKDLEDFISKGKDGFILFSMGSAIRGDMMPDSKRKMILDVFSKLKQQVLWKWESETMPDLPKNVKLAKWLPQQDLLGHKDIKMFITHCGGGSTEEAIYHGVPLIGIPMFADQPQNADLARGHGLIVQLDWNDLAEENFKGAIQTILNDPTYTNNAKKLSALFKDRPKDPLELGVYWIEYVLRHNGAPHLRSVGRKLNALQYHSVDVIAAYVAIVVTTLYLVFSLLRFIFRKLFRRSNNKSQSVGIKKKRN
ncbi:unnamed protein product [Orchesella dallaii]|uniref:UDP-glucuronosyltransferase n=1 Tax=Orchesella dallaii TaxID=48710 RepID=A0ABP1Q055_9HEXA